MNTSLWHKGYNGTDSWVFLQRQRQDSGANIAKIQTYSYEPYSLGHPDCSLTLN